MCQFNLNAASSILRFFIVFYFLYSRKKREINLIHICFFPIRKALPKAFLKSFALKLQGIFPGFFFIPMQYVFQSCICKSMFKRKAFFYGNTFARMEKKITRKKFTLFFSTSRVTNCLVFIFCNPRLYICTRNSNQQNLLIQIV